MKLSQFLVILACVMGIAVGQLLFKRAALTLPSPISPMGVATNGWLVIALIVYAFATAGWIYVLREVPLSLAYPIFALAFIAVPLLSWLVHGEVVRINQWLGAGLIVCGIVVATR